MSLPRSGKLSRGSLLRDTKITLFTEKKWQ